MNHKMITIAIRMYISCGVWRVQISQSMCVNLHLSMIMSWSAGLKSSLISTYWSQSHYTRFICAFKIICRFLQKKKESQFEGFLY